MAEKFKAIGKVKVENNLADRRINNTYRKNSIGEYAADTAPDVTVSLEHSACRTQGDGKDAILTGKIRNRGTKPIPQALPTLFCVIDGSGKVVNKCQHMSEQGFGIGACRNIECNIGKAGDLKGMTIKVVGNETLQGDRLIVECNDGNNTVTTVIQSCPLIIN